ncbi:hypothetical protein [Legionella worsleiensis]|uniref:Uncharacterized protein n=1 Tax=Legionella worsleiensis TaxID=45076 RepID=A0A0W1A5X2_9GAMM|nr:hypothetical protein [Legionella worsleiensis]KTD76730.1 hypothetical protein Lwor_1955 [Legionella worsleiensis]STY30516.1 Uncharacterised protein [Legionella worsleiensis]
MQSAEYQIDKMSEDISLLDDEQLHARACYCINQSYRMIFQELPQIISQIIERDVWKKRTHTYENFGEYVLGALPDGLGIANNDLLWVIKTVMNKSNQHAAHWADVLEEVENSVRMFAKEKKIPVRALHRDLLEQDTDLQDVAQEHALTYLPSRSKSFDGQLLKLKAKDPESYDNVIQGKMKIKEALPQTTRKKLHPIESVKNKFSSLSKSDREAFLAWLEQEMEHLA